MHHLQHVIKTLLKICCRAPLPLWIHCLPPGWPVDALDPDSGCDVAFSALSPCCQCLRRPPPPHNPPQRLFRSCGSLHNTSLTPSDIRLQQWVEILYTRSFAALCPSPGQGHDAEALMGKPDAHIDKHTLPYQTHIMCIYNTDNKSQLWPCWTWRKKWEDRSWSELIK